jgi:hypothetical protein
MTGLIAAYIIISALGLGLLLWAVGEAKGKDECE